MPEIKVLSDGIEFLATYETFGDTLRVLLPEWEPSRD